MRLIFTHLTGSLLLLLGLSSFAYAQTATVQGQITDPRGEAVPGITVMLNDSREVATDVSGNFTISNIPPGNHTLSVSGVGYQTQTLFVTLTAGQTKQINIRLDEGTTQMEEVVVEGKSEATRVREQAYAVAAINARELAHRTVDMNQLITRTAGVRVRESGGLGSGFDYSINGMSGRAIRFFVDGVPLDRYGSGYSIKTFR